MKHRQRFFAAVNCHWAAPSRLGFAVILAALLPVHVAALAQTGGSLQNESLRVRLDSGWLVEVRHLKTGHNFARPGRALWELDLVSGAEMLTLNATQAGSVQETQLDCIKPRRRFVWRDFPSPFSPTLMVQVEVELEPRDQAARWRIAVNGLNSFTLREARFPILHGLEPQAREQLAVPVWMGQITSEPRRILSGADNKGRKLQWHYPGELSLQCLAFSGEKAGLYLACDDTAAFRKAFTVMGDGSGRLGCHVVHWPELDDAPARNWALPYEVITGTFEGDWFTAAERYRSWATNQVWAVESRVATQTVPDWISRTALWVWNRGRSKDVLGPALELQRRLDLPVSAFWHWWHGCAYDMGFPEYLPPREGAIEFKNAVADAHRRGVNTLVYMNQRLWGMTTESWAREGAAAWAVKGADGRIHPEIYNTFTRAPCASMCLGTEFWRHKYAGIAEEAVTGLGVGGIYMDQACLSLSCYDETHGHPIGGGAYWVNGFRLLASEIRERCANRRGRPRQSTRAALPALAGEGCGEPWLPQLDLMLSLQVSRERYAVPDGWETIPFFHAVYHPQANLFGNYSSLTLPPYDELWPAEFAPKEPLKVLDRKFASQFCLEQARAFVWGQQPTIANFKPEHLTSRAEEVDYVLRLAQLGHLAAKHLRQGVLLRSPVLEVQEAAIPFSRLSIYAGQQESIKSFVKTVPLAICAAWRAPDGQVAVALASIADQPLAACLRIPVKEYGIQPGARITRLDTRGRKVIGSVDAELTILRLELSARAASVLHFDLESKRRARK